MRHYEADVNHTFAWLTWKKQNNIELIIFHTLILFCPFIFFGALSDAQSCLDDPCVFGKCLYDTCICEQGWKGPHCEYCTGKIRLTGSSGEIIDGFGNYSLSNRCAWLIDSGSPNNTIRLRFEFFETECGWDQLFVFDGDSIYSKLIAIYSGTLTTSMTRLPEIETTSGYAYVLFFSDPVFSLTGFHISYRINSCPTNVTGLNCSGNGVCIDGVCTCSGGFTGQACDVEICPDNCGAHGSCNMENHQCVCDPGFKGPDCSQSIYDGYWEFLEPKNSTIPPGRASHSTVLYRDSMLVIAGQAFVKSEHVMIDSFDFLSQSWSKVNSKGDFHPSSRFGQSVVIHGKDLFMFGGISSNGTVLSELLSFNLENQTWSRVDPAPRSCKGVLCGPLAVFGHTAVDLDDSLLIIFGYCPSYGFLNIVQEYQYSTGDMNILENKGAVFKGRYGHTSVYDRGSNRVYVHGGFTVSGPTNHYLSDELLSFDPLSKVWQLHSPSQRKRFLHSAAIINGTILLFGGNTNNGSFNNNAARCYSQEFQAYDILCDTWSFLDLPSHMTDTIARVGHTAVVYSGAMYLYGGFNGLMQDSILKYTPGQCSHKSSNYSCLSFPSGLKCMWNVDMDKCEAGGPASTNLSLSYQTCDPSLYSNYSQLCSDITSCSSCYHSTYHCVWCQSGCSYGSCVNDTTSFLSAAECSVGETSVCNLYNNCHSCHTEYYCNWEADNKCYLYIERKGNKTEKAQLQYDRSSSCSTPCYLKTDCESCTKRTTSCLWCLNTNKCIESSAYLPYFLYGDCMEWTTQAHNCRKIPYGGTSCESHKNCSACHDDPACGWCDDGSGTGLGRCLEGGSKGPILHKSKEYYITRKCSRRNWYFTTCPSCQCNGHSLCNNDNATCSQPCADLTEGSHCQYCIAGFYGDATNGGECNGCSCNGHGTSCDRETGRCLCTTKGVIGDHCDKCDNSNSYFGHPLGGTCYYNLSIDFQFTFNLSKKEDSHFTQINFMSSPVKPDVDAEFFISCNVRARVNITVRSGFNATDKLLFSNLTCDFKTRFSKSEFIFGLHRNTTFYIYVYDFQPPLWLQIAFSQHAKLDLLQFFITFSTCFLSLLILAAILWKIKQKYDMYRRRQRMFVEMEQMASRPFSRVILDVDKQDGLDPPEGSLMAKRKKRGFPSPVALEPCAGNRAAVLSLVVSLPYGGEPCTPSGQSGLSLGSALVTLGTQKKQNSGDGGQTKELRIKYKKPTIHQQPDPCT